MSITFKTTKELMNLNVGDVIIHINGGDTGRYDKGCAMKDFRIKVTVEFTIDVGVTETKTWAALDVANDITEEVFKKSFSRAHLLKIETEELMELK